MAQVDEILFHLQRRGTITQVEAHELYRVYRLASRIHELKQRGLNIEGRTKYDLTGTRYTEYRLLPV